MTEFDPSSEIEFLKTPTKKLKEDIDANKKSPEIIIYSSEDNIFNQFPPLLKPPEKSLEKLKTSPPGSLGLFTTAVGETTLPTQVLGA